MPHLWRILKSLTHDDMAKKNDLARKLFMTLGVTFTVYDSGEGIEKIFPFDVIPRIINAQEWGMIESGIKQRLRALNIFLKIFITNTLFETTDHTI